MAESNATPEEIAAASAEQRRRNACPVCGARHRRTEFMREFDLQLIEFLRTNNITRRDSCITCVEKHIGYAKRLFAESLTLQDAPRGSIELNHLDIIGELRAATEEASEYETLYRTLLQAERDYRYEGLEPAWSKIAEMIVEVKSNSSKEK